MAFSFLELNSLRSRLMLVVALAIAPAVLMTAYTGWRERQQAIANAEESLQRLTNMAGANEAQSLKSARQILSDLSGVPDLLADTEKCEALLRTVLRRNPDYANFGLIQLNGDVTCSAVPSPTRVNLADRAHFRRAIDEGRFIAGDYVFGRVIRKHTINLTYPVIDSNNEVQAVVFAAMDLAALDKFVDNIDLPPGSILITADSGGTIISRRPEPEKWFGEQVSKEMRDAMAEELRNPVVLKGPDGIARLHAFARIGTPDISDYTVTIGIPSEDIVGPIRHDHNMALLALAAIMVLALLATWFVGDFMIVRRVRALVGAAKKIAAGDLAARTGIEYGREEIGYLARTFDDMANSLQRHEAERDRAEKELRAADRRKDEFLAMLAHELRNPLAPVSVAAQVLKVAELDEERVRQTSDIIARQVDHMTSLIDDLLDVSRVTRGLVSIENQLLDLKQVVFDAVEQVTPVVTARRHHLSLDLPQEPVIVNGDHKRLVQVIANLLNNSAKYTPEGGTIVLAIELQRDEVVLSVADNGIGMEPELVSRVFDLFAQAERTSDRSQGGLGVGLALVRSLVGLHRGSVQAASKGTGEGSTFSVRLPRATAQHAPAVHKGDSRMTKERASALRLMVVDDNADAARALAMFLESEGHDVVVAHEASGALAHARGVSPDVCLLDIGLPGMDGNELARRLRAMPETAESVLIAVTGYGQEHDRRKAIAAGFDYHFVKPVDTSKLAALLGEIGVR